MNLHVQNGVAREGGCRRAWYTLVGPCPNNLSLHSISFLVKGKILRRLFSLIILLMGVILHYHLVQQPTLLSQVGGVWGELQPLGGFVMCCAMDGERIATARLPSSVLRRRRGEWWETESRRLWRVTVVIVRYLLSIVCCCEEREGCRVYLAAHL